MFTKINDDNKTELECFIQLLQRCGSGTTGPVSVKNYLEVTIYK